MGSEGADGPASAFEEELSALKREGCNLLVAGPAVRGLHARACGEMLGDVAAGPRRHLFVLPSGGPAVGAGPDEGHADATVVAGDDDVRGAATYDGGRRVENAGVAALGDAVTTEIARIDREADGLAAAELRVCVDAVSRLWADHDRGAVRRFLETVTDRVREADGLGHYHCAGDPDGAAVRGLAPLFEASVELRVAETPRQRWHLHDAGLSSEWLPL